MKRLLTICVAMVVMGGSVWGFSGSGSGTEANPYVITDINQLQEMNNNLTACYALGNDIDALITSTWNGGAGFNPIGTGATQFAGKFDGKNKKIMNLFVNHPSIRGAGLFLYASTSSSIQNTILLNCSIVGADTVGSLVGRNEGTITNCYSTGSIACPATTQFGDVGGFVGTNHNGGKIIDCYTSCSVSGRKDVGGFVGWFGNGSISNCYSTGPVSSSSDGTAGGFVGVQSTGDISNCYSTSSVFGSGTPYIGGFVGYLQNDSITNCYSTGSVSGVGYTAIGGFAGAQIGGSGNSCYWDTQTSGQATSALGTGKTTAQMNQQATFTGWDFNNIWDIDEGKNYPILKWTIEPCPIITVILGIHPNTLNLQSKGNWITCIISFPPDVNTTDIDSNSVLLNDQIKAEWTQVGDENHILLAKFNRSAIEDILQPGIVELTVSGNLIDGKRFEGKDTITVSKTPN